MAFPRVRRRTLLATLGAVAVAGASLPLAWRGANGGLGVGSLLVVPEFAVAIWMLLTAVDRRRRAWWFGFATAVGFCLPLGDFVLAMAAAHETIEAWTMLPPNIVEKLIYCGALLGPLVLSGMLGVLAGRVCRRLTGSGAAGDSPDAERPRWRLTIRELAIGIAAVGLLLAWNLSQLKQGRAIDHHRQQHFLAAFEASFKSGEIRLLAAPKLEENPRRIFRSGLIRPDGVNEYRVVAPLERNGERLWGVWRYYSNDIGTSSIYGFAYAEASKKRQLPRSPRPIPATIEPTCFLVDGVPDTMGPTPTIVSVTSPANRDAPLQLRAAAPPGTICELSVFPSTNVDSPPQPIQVDKTGIVQWTWRLKPGPTSDTLGYEVRCTQTRGSEQLFGRTTGNIQIVAPTKP